MESLFDHDYINSSENPDIAGNKNLSTHDGNGLTCEAEESREINDPEVEINQECEAAVNAIEHDGSVVIEETNYDIEEMAITENAEAFTEEYHNQLKESLGSSTDSASNDVSALDSNPKPPIVIKRWLRGFGFTLRAIQVYLGDLDTYQLQHVVVAVAEDGPAFEAGLRQGDIITHVNDEAIHGLPHKDVLRLIQKSGKELCICSAPQDSATITQDLPCSSEECTTNVDSLLNLFPFVCGFCCLQFNKVNLYFKHLTTHVEIKDDLFHICFDEETKKGFICSLCDKVFPTVCLLHDHMLNKEYVNNYIFDKSTSTSTTTRFHTVIDHSGNSKSTIRMSASTPKSTEGKMSNTKALNLTLYKDGAIQHIQLNPVTKSPVRKSIRLPRPRGVLKRKGCDSTIVNMNDKDSNASMEVAYDKTENDKVNNEEITPTKTSKAKKTWDRSGKRIPCRLCGRRIQKGAWKRHQEIHSLNKSDKKAKGVARKKVLPASVYAKVKSEKSSSFETPNDVGEADNASMEVTNDKIETVDKVEETKNEEVDKTKPSNSKKSWDRSGLRIPCHLCSKRIQKGAWKRHQEIHARAKAEKSSPLEAPKEEGEVDNANMDVIHDKAENVVKVEVFSDADTNKETFESDDDQLESMIAKTSGNKRQSKKVKKYSQKAVESNNNPHTTWADSIFISSQEFNDKVKKPKQSKTSEKSEIPWEKIKVPCQHCGKFISKPKLNRHEALHNSMPLQKSEKRKHAWYGGGPRVPCQYCGREMRKNNLKRHEEVHLLPPTDGKKPCKVCGVRIGNGNLRKHEATHFEQAMVPCQFCGKMIREGGLRDHERIHKKLEPQQNSDKPKKSWSRSGERAPCRVCGRNIQLGALQRHEEAHSAPKSVQSYPCPECGKIFQFGNKLNQHMTVHYGAKDHVCDICEKAFKWKGCLVKHKLIHSQTERNIQCPVCPAKFKTQDVLRGHMKKHKDKEKFVCNICGYSSYRSDVLTRHKAMHTDARPFPCSECDKAFKDKSVLRKHMKLHQPYKYSCPFCDKRFAYSNKRKEHVKTHLRQADLEAISSIIIETDTTTVVDARTLETIEYST